MKGAATTPPRYPPGPDRDAIVSALVRRAKALKDEAEIAARDARIHSLAHVAYYAAMHLAKAVITQKDGTFPRPIAAAMNAAVQPDSPT